MASKGNSLLQAWRKWQPRHPAESGAHDVLEQGDVSMTDKGRCLFRHDDEEQSSSVAGGDGEDDGMQRWSEEDLLGHQSPQSVVDPKAPGIVIGTIGVNKALKESTKFQPGGSNLAEQEKGGVDRATCRVQGSRRT